MAKEPTLEKCREMGLWCRWDAKAERYVECVASHPHAREDMKKLDMILQGKYPYSMTCNGKGK